MTAAALRPELLTHLFATQRRHPEKGDFAASAISLLLHGGAALAVVWASSTLAGDDISVAETPPMPIVIATPEPRTSNGGGGGGEGPSSRPIVLPPSLDEPLPDPRTSPSPIDDWAPPGDRLPGTRDTPQPGAPGSGSNPETRAGFEVSRVIPRLLNASEVQRALERNYPPILRDAGVGGRVTLWLLVDESGRVVETDIRESSGQAAFDAAAAKVGEIMRFSPGMNRSDRVKVWVSLPIVFRTN